MGGNGAASGAGHPAAETRTGFATDGHPFGPGDGLWLGGVEIPEYLARLTPDTPIVPTPAPQENGKATAKEV